MRILMISAEGPPLERRGALVDVLDALPGALRARGNEVSVVLPFYREIKENRAFKKKNIGISVDVRVGDKTYVARYLEGRSAGGVQLFLIRCDEFFDRDGIYGEHGKQYEDNAARFIFFCKAAIELARRLTPQLQILHVHDWPAALVPVFVYAQGLPFKTVLTIHHVADQGSSWGLDFGLTNLPEQFFTLRGVEFFGRLNFLKGGILFSDRITTVSEHYRREILTPSGGCGLDGVLGENAHRLTVILDGADYTRWNPTSDRLIPARYDARRLRGKQICRDGLLKETKLDSAPRGGARDRWNRGNNRRLRSDYGQRLRFSLLRVFQRGFLGRNQACAANLSRPAPLDEVDETGNDAQFFVGRIRGGLRNAVPRARYD